MLLHHPLGAFGIIGSLLILKKIFHVQIDKEQELHRNWGVLGGPTARFPFTLNLENKQLVGQPLRTLFGLLKEHVVVSRMYHNGEIITPTPDIILQQVMCY